MQAIQQAALHVVTEVGVDSDRVEPVQDAGLFESFADEHFGAVAAAGQHHNECVIPRFWRRCLDSRNRHLGRRHAEATG